MCDADGIVDPSAGLPLDWTYKGLPLEFEGLTQTEIGDAGASLFDDRILFPTAIIRDSVLRSNSRWMREFIRKSGVQIAPHGKTTMAPDLFRLQFEDGAWAVTAATVQQVRAYRHFGVKRIFLANQVVGRGEIDLLVSELHANPELELYVLVDSIAGVDALAEGVRRRPLSRRLQVLVESGYLGGRAGVRSVAEGIAVARAIRAAHGELALVGIETFEGIVQMGENALAEASTMIRNVAELASECDRLELFENEIILSAGGSAFFDVAADALSTVNLSQTPLVVVRSGCYLTHDDGMYGALVAKLLQRRPELAALEGRLRPALQVWGRVLSRPENGRIICGLGKRDAGSDAGFPQPLSWVPAGQNEVQVVPPGHTTVALNDQHTFVDGPEMGPLQVGDYVGFGVSHPCTTFDKWRALLRVDDNYRITGIVRTYF